MRKHRRPYRSAATLDALIMRLLRQSSEPLTAHEIARRASEGKTPVASAQVYRVLDRLTEGNEVQRVELLSAYLPSLGEQHGFMVCRWCRSVRPFPAPNLRQTMRRLCRAASFLPSRMIFESWGVCAACESEAEKAEFASGKERTMGRKMKGLLTLMMAAGAMVAAMPADAAVAHSPATPFFHRVDVAFPTLNIAQEGHALVTPAGVSGRYRRRP